jgi:HlyD family secretion protein
MKLLSPLILLVLVTSCTSKDDVFDASGVFEAEEIIISSEVAGKVLHFPIEEGSQLGANQEVGSIDCKNLELQKAQVEASIEALSEKQFSATPQNEIIKEQLITQEKQTATQAQQLQILEKEQTRLQNLVRANAAPAKQLDDIDGQINVLKKQIEASLSQKEVLKRQISSQNQQVAIQNRGILSETKPLKERIAQLNDQLQRCAITNPSAGTVLVKYIKTNEVVTPGKPLYKLADLSNMTLRIYLTGDQLTKVKLNQSVKVFIDQGQEELKELTGTMQWISDKAEFTPKTIQTKDERANLVYAAKVRIKNDGYLRIGMYGEIRF